MSDLENELAIVCHDAGGAEILSSYVKQKGIKPYYCIEGPALGIFERKLGVIKSTAFDKVLTQANCFLCGTSWQSDLECRVFEMAKKMGKKTIAFLDHWVNYQERFNRNGVMHLPNEIWVGDKYAEAMARGVFPDKLITLIENPYFEEIYNQFQDIAVNNSLHVCNSQVLFLSDNLDEAMLKMHSDPRYLGYTDLDVLKYLSENIDIFSEEITKIIIRPHPSELREKYDRVKERYGGLVEVGGDLTLLEEIAESGIIVGGNSMAMVMALICGKRVISCIPPGGRGFSLPYDAIEKMQDLVALHCRL